MSVVTAPTGNAGDGADGGGDDPNGGGANGGGANGGGANGDGGGGGGGGGPTLGSRNTALIVIVVVVVGIVLIVFSLAGPSRPTEQPMPQLQAMGLQYAVAKARAADWKRVESYDALGQNRGIGDEREWRVCFQSPKAGDTPTRRLVSLGAVQTDEPCPVKNYGELQQVYDSVGTTGTHVVPDLYQFTPYMARKAFGEDASIRVLRLPVKKTEKKSGGFTIDLLPSRNSDDEVTGGLGNWMICQQDPVAGSSWNGQVLTLHVVAVEDEACPAG